MSELMPIMSGFFIGSSLYFVPPRAAGAAYRLIVSLLLILSFGFLAAFTSGEFQISWMFLLIDIPMVAGSAVAGFTGAHYLRSFLRKPA